ncbi:MAG: hypothetical protein J6M03_07635 [Clostridia bacterium]|nr:hypothetical protein [Clostridia bacterium]
MNKQEIFNGLWTITKEKYNACKTNATSVDKNHPTERGALQLKVGIYNVAIAAGLISGTDQAIELMSKRFKNLIKHFPDISNYYHTLLDDQKELMEISLYPEVFMRANFYNTYNTDLKQAELYGDPQKIFKARIKKEVLDDILNMWRDFRVQNDLFTFAFGETEEQDERKA